MLPIAITMASQAGGDVRNRIGREIARIPSPIALRRRWRAAMASAAAVARPSTPSMDAADAIVSGSTHSRAAVAFPVAEMGSASAIPCTDDRNNKLTICKSFTLNGYSSAPELVDLD